MTDVGLAGAVLAAAEIAIVTGRETDSISRDPLAYALGVAMAAPVLLRRRFPVGALYLVSAALMLFYALGYPGFPPALVLAVPLYDAVRAGRPWRALPVPVVFLVLGHITALRRGMPPLDVVSAFLPQTAVTAVAMLLGALVRSRRAHAEEARRRLRMAEEERERDGERRVIQERLRIARELHDTVAHAITTITVQSGVALHLVDREPDRAREALTAIRQTGKAALAEMRATLDMLRADGEPAAADRDAGLDRLPDLLAAVRAAGLELTFDGGMGDRRPAAPVDHAAYRILQESLTNVLRHAGLAARARVRLLSEPEWLVIEVDDDGVGAGPEARSGGHGLAGMRERAEGLGGGFEAGARPGGGFRVRARLPLEAA
ncbi:sensor histidine kinase [Streptosporangium sp. NPDC004379]|uniref:sensor histidine kinase n=1 Tax=Streptosporangium sp. NPDC004379 TaxID=3366189 RepID=UPI0036C8668C